MVCNQRLQHSPAAKVGLCLLDQLSSHRVLPTLISLCFFLVPPLASLAGFPPVVWQDSSPSGTDQTTEVAGSGPAQPADLQQEYIRQLNSPSFLERQQAMQALLSYGSSALGPLAFEILSGSPESVWRSKQAIEAIATAGDEPTFFQAANILLLLFNSNNQQVNLRIEELELQWRQEQKQMVLRKLREKGAGVVEAGEGQDLFARENLNLGRPGVIVIDGPISLDLLPTTREGLDSSESTPSAASLPIARSTEEMTGQIQRILNGSLEENRIRLFESRQGGNPSSQVASELNRRRQLGEELKQREIEMLLEIEMQMQMREMGAMQRLTMSSLQITLDDQWQGSELELKELARIQESIFLRVAEIDLPVSQIKELLNIPAIENLEVVGNQLDPTKLELLLQTPSLSRVSLVERELQQFFTDPVSVDHIKGLALQRCELGSGAIEQLIGFSQLISLDFLEMQLAEPLFLQIEKLDGLRAIEMQVCKFPKDSYLRLKRTAPQISINFTPQGFLGVRGPLRFGEDFDKVEISQVVPDSAAEQGGMLAGDVIKSIDGVRLDRFEDLRLQVAQYKAGEKLKVVIERNGQEKQLTIELKPYDSSIE